MFGFLLTPEQWPMTWPCVVRQRAMDTWSVKGMPGWGGSLVEMAMALEGCITVGHAYDG